LKSVLDDELGRLPKHYREPLLLCYLQDKTQEEAAKLLGWSLGAVRGRLFRGREMLRRRLAARGLTLSAALFAIVLVQSGARAHVPVALVEVTSQIALSFATGSAVSSPVSLLAQGVLQSMFWNKIKTVTASIVAILIVCTGAGLIIHQALADRPGEGVAARSGGVIADPHRTTRAPDEEKKKGEEAEDLPGIIKVVDEAKNLLTVQVEIEDEKMEKTYDALGSKILVCGKPGKIGDLKINMRCLLRIAKNGTNLDEIKANWPKLHCDFKQADAVKGTVTVVVEANDQSFDLVLQLEKDGIVKVGDLHAGLADLPTGAEVEVELTLDKKGIVSVQTDKPRGDVAAILKSVNTAKRSLLVTVELDDEQLDLAFDLAADAKVRIIGKDGDLSGLKEGMRVDLKLAEDRKTVVTVRADVAPPQKRDDD
jgi:hypothetical protein